MVAIFSAVVLLGQSSQEVVQLDNFLVAGVAAEHEQQDWKSLEIELKFKGDLPKGEHWCLRTLHASNSSNEIFSNGQPLFSTSDLTKYKQVISGCLEKTVLKDL